MYCKKCGLPLDDDSYFCPECGTPVDRSKIRTDSEFKPESKFVEYENTHSDNQYKKQGYNQIVPLQKNPGISVILALFIGAIGFMGVGHMYAGKVKAGMIFLIIGFIMNAIFLIFLYEYNMKLSNFTDVMIILFFLVCICDISIYIWQIYDAYIITKEYNNTILKTGHAPW